MDKLLKILVLLCAALVPLFANHDGSQDLSTTFINRANGGGNEDCPAGTTLAAKFNFVGGQYVYETGLGSNVVTITNGSETGGNFTSNVLISSIVIKGGNDAVIEEVNPPSLTGSFSNANVPPNPNGQPPAISNIKFCTPDIVPSNTPTDTPTNTEVPPSATPTDTPTNTEVPPSATPTDTPTNTEVPPSATPTDTPTNTEVPPSATPTDTPTNTEVPPSATPTDTPTQTPVGTSEVTPDVTPESTPDFSA
jgi:hypothetical protein